jgi:hypothetical protein
MQNQFQLLNNHVLTGIPFDVNAFRTKALGHLNDNPSDNDKFFNEFTPAWNMLIGGGRHIHAEHLWIFAEQIAQAWERQNPGRTIHKGTAFYFWSVTCLLVEKFSKTFLLMHKALNEDNRTHGPTIMTAARAFVRLDNNYGAQFAKPVVQSIADFLDKLIDEYRNTRGGTLTLSDFQNKFLHSSVYEEDAFWLVYCLHSADNYFGTKIWGLGDTQFGRSFLARSVSDLCLALENMLSNKVTGKTLSPKIDSHDRSLLTPIRDNLNRADLGDALEDILTGSSKCGITFTSERQRDFACVYLLRNHASHEIHGYDVIQSQYERITKRVFFALFEIVEIRY